MIKRLTGIALSLGVHVMDVVGERAWRLLGRPRTSGVVLYYHAVKSAQRHRFARQMDELLRRTHPFSAGSSGGMAHGTRNAAVTFDDGFRSVVENAVPELAQRSIPFTMFVPTGCLGERPSWVQDPRHPSWNESVLSPEELRALANMPEAKLGAHSVTHRNLRKVDTAQARCELEQSRSDLQAATGMDVDLFSFPHGAHSPALLDAARRAGYRHVFTIEPTVLERDTLPFSVGRVAVDPDDWWIEFRLKLTGAYRWRSYFHALREAM